MYHTVWYGTPSSCLFHTAQLESYSEKYMPVEYKKKELCKKRAFFHFLVYFWERKCHESCISLLSFLRVKTELFDANVYCMYRGRRRGRSLAATRFFEIQTQVDKSHACVTAGGDQWGCLLNNQPFVAQPMLISTGKTRVLTDHNSCDIVWSVKCCVHKS